MGAHLACLEPCNTVPYTTTPSTVEMPLLSPLPLLPSSPTDACFSRKSSVTLLHGFVQELIYCSHNSKTVLQTAPHYIGVVCQKVVEIVSMPVVSMKGATPEEHPQDSESLSPEPLALLPLLCPCWTLLTSLILASKFLQDRHCSN